MFLGANITLDVKINRSFHRGIAEILLNDRYLPDRQFKPRFFVNFLGHFSYEFAG